MEIVKKNLLSISCGVIALLAFIAWFWPIGSLYSDFQASLDKRVAMNTQIRNLKTRPRQVPPIGPTGESQPLASFPNKPTIDVVDAAIKSLKDKSDQALLFMVAMNRAGHDLLEPGSLPVPIDSNQSYRFRAQYNAVMDYGGKPEPWDRRNPEAGPLNLLDQVLNATPAATPVEVEDARKKKFDTEYLPKVYTVNGQQIGLAEAQEAFEKDTVDFAKKFHEKRASQFKIYCDADGLTRAPRLTQTDTPSVTDIWFAQMTLWVEQDVCQTIREMNRDVVLQPNQGIAESPVKNLIDVTVSPDFRMYVVGQAVNPALGAPPPQELDPSTKMFDISPTGRVCNSLYDVVKFHVSVVVLPSHLPEFLQRLRYQRLLTVTSMSVQDVDWKAAAELGYIYGPARCVEVSLDCEELFLRDWTVRQIVPDPNHPAPMPVDVQKLLGITPQAPAAGQTPAKVAMQ